MEQGSEKLYFIFRIKITISKIHIPFHLQPSPLLLSLTLPTIFPPPSPLLNLKQLSLLSPNRLRKRTPRHARIQVILQPPTTTQFLIAHTHTRASARLGSSERSSGLGLLGRSNTDTAFLDADVQVCVRTCWVRGVCCGVGEAEGGVHGLGCCAAGGVSFVWWWGG